MSLMRVVIHSPLPFPLSLSPGSSDLGEDLQQVAVVVVVDQDVQLFDLRAGCIVG